MGTATETYADRFVRTFDARETPRYTTGEAARYLGIAESTLRSWFYGTVYGYRPDLRRFPPFLRPASRDLLSFYDIASAHVLMALKYKGVTSDELRVVVRSLQAEFPHSRYPLLGRDFYMFGRQVILKQLDELMNLTRSRQMGIKAIMARFLSRLDLDDDKMPLRFSPLKSPMSRGEGLIVIDPDLGYGKPVVKGTGISAEVIAKRRKSGESVSSLAHDYRLSRRAIEEAVKYFNDKSKAA